MTSPVTVLAALLVGVATVQASVGPLVDASGRRQLRMALSERHQLQIGSFSTLLGREHEAKRRSDGGRSLIGAYAFTSPSSFVPAALGLTGQ